MDNFLYRDALDFETFPELEETAPRTPLEKIFEESSAVLDTHWSSMIPVEEVPFNQPSALAPKRPRVLSSLSQNPASVHSETLQSWSQLSERLKSLLNQGHNVAAFAPDFKPVEETNGDFTPGVLELESILKTHLGWKKVESFLTHGDIQRALVHLEKSQGRILVFKPYCLTQLTLSEISVVLMIVCPRTQVSYLHQVFQILSRRPQPQTLLRICTGSFSKEFQQQLILSDFALRKTNASIHPLPDSYLPTPAPTADVAQLSSSSSGLPPTPPSGYHRHSDLPPQSASQ